MNKLLYNNCTLRVSDMETLTGEMIFQSISKWESKSINTNEVEVQIGLGKNLVTKVKVRRDMKKISPHGGGYVKGIENYPYNSILKVPSDESFGIDEILLHIALSIKFSDFCIATPSNIFQIFYENNHISYSLEMIEYPNDLSHFIEQEGKSLTPLQKKIIFLSIAHHLISFHTKGMLVLDLKPDNILLYRIPNDNYIIVFTDFSSVRSMKGESEERAKKLKADLLVKGSYGFTPLYAYGKEEGKTAAASTETDIYKLLLVGVQISEFTNNPAEYLENLASTSRPKDEFEELILDLYKNMNDNYLKQVIEKNKDSLNCPFPDEPFVDEGIFWQFFPQLLAFENEKLIEKFESYLQFLGIDYFNCFLDMAKTKNYDEIIRLFLKRYFIDIKDEDLNELCKVIRAKGIWHLKNLFKVVDFLRVTFVILKYGVRDYYDKILQQRLNIQNPSYIHTSIVYLSEEPMITYLLFDKYPCDLFIAWAIKNLENEENLKYYIKDNQYYAWLVIHSIFSRLGFIQPFMDLVCIIADRVNELHMILLYVVNKLFDVSPYSCTPKDISFEERKKLALEIGGILAIPNDVMSKYIKEVEEIWWRLEFT